MKNAPGAIAETRGVCPDSSLHLVEPGKADGSVRGSSPRMWGTIFMGKPGRESRVFGSATYSHV